MRLFSHRVFVVAQLVGDGDGDDNHDNVRK